jgi:hypothetical protein
MSEPRWKNERAVQGSMVYAISLLNEGELPEVIQARLVERGLTEEDAAGVVYNLLMDSLYGEAVDMLNRGMFPDQVKEKLAAKGLEHQTASGIIEDILEQSRLPPEAPDVPESVSGMLLKLLGGAIFVVGLGLFFGNTTGGFPTFPFAGYIVMGIGALIWGTSEAR